MEILPIDYANATDLLDHKLKQPQYAAYAKDRKLKEMLFDDLLRQEMEARRINANKI